MKLTTEKMKRLYDDGSIRAAAEWIDQQDDPFGIIQSMKKNGNLALLLAHYKTDESVAAHTEKEGMVI